MKKISSFIICIIVVIFAFSACAETQNNSSALPPLERDFTGCKVEVLEHGIYGGKSLGELNVYDTKYFIEIITAMELGEEVQNYDIADGESAKQYLITLANGEESYFGQGYGQAQGYPNASFVHINDKVYTIKNPAVLNALYVIIERFTFYDRLSSQIN